MLPSFSVVFSRCYKLILGYEDWKVFLLLLWRPWRSFPLQMLGHTSIHFISSSLWLYLYSCMHIMSILCSAAVSVSSDNWHFLFKVLTLNVTMFTVLLHLSNFGLGLIGFVWFDLVLWRIKPYRLFKAKSSLYLYIKYIWFGWVGFYGISIIVGYLMPNPLYKYILNI